MTRYGTLLGLHGKPTDRVIIMRKGPKTTRVKLPWPDKPGFNPDEVRVDTDTVLDDGGALWKKCQHTPHAATWLSYSGQPQGLLHVHRVYKNVIKASLYEGNGSWSVVEDFHPDNVRFDAGEGWPKARTDELVTSTAQQPASVATPTTLAPPVKKGPVFHAPTTDPQPATRPAARSPQQSSVATPPTSKPQKLSQQKLHNQQQHLLSQRQKPQLAGNAWATCVYQALIKTSPDNVKHSEFLIENLLTNSPHDHAHTALV